MILKTNSKQFTKANKSSDLASVFRFLKFALCIAIILCSTLTVQSAENSDLEPLNCNKTPLPELNKKDRASTINSGDTVVFDYSQAVFVNGNLKFPVSIISDDPQVGSLDFSFRFNNVDFTYDNVLNTYNLTDLNGFFNPTDLKLRVSSFNLNFLPNNTNLVTLSFNTTSTEFCALNPYDILVYLNGEPCSYKVIGCLNVPAYAGIDQNICSDTTILAANSIFAGTASWTVISGSGTFANPNQPATSVSGLSAGANVFRWTFPANSNTPETFDEVTIFRNLPPSIAIAGDDYIECLNSTILPAEIPTIGTGAWTLLQGTGSIQDFTNPNSLFTFTIPGVYDLEWRTSSGNCPETADTIRIEKLESASAGADIFLCESQATLTAIPSPIYSGYWTLVAGTGVIEDSASAITNVSGLSLGENIFTWTLIDSNCPVNSTDSVSVNIIEQSLAAAGVDQAVCGANAQLEAEVPTIGSGFWASLNSSIIIAEPTNPLSAVSNLSFGVDTLIWTTTNGTCTSVDTVLITSFEPIQASAGVDQTVCGNNAQLEAVSPTIGSGIWSSVSASVIFADETNYQTTVNNLSLGADTLFWTITNGVCSSIDTVIVTSIELPVAIAGVDQTICGNSALLEAINPTVGSGIWSSVNASVIFTDATNYQTSVSNLSFAADTLFWTTTNGICSVVDTVVITSFEQIQASAGVDQTICGNSAQLEAVSPTIGSGIWSSVNASVIFADATNYQTSASNLSFGVDTLIWTVTNGTCTSVDSVFITSNILLVANAGEDQTNCGNSTILAASIPENGSGVWTSLNSSIIIEEPTNPLSAVSNLTFGVDTLIWTITVDFCTSVDSVFITSIVQPQAFAGLDTTICELQQPLTIPISITGSNNWTWTAILGNAAIDNELSLFPSFSLMSLGENSFELVAKNGNCAAYDTLNIFVYGDESEYCNTKPIFIPEGFSPNGDGSYDVFKILNLNGLNADVKIFNRWGILVYSNENYQNDWTGIANQGLVVYGEELPAGTYFYIIQIEGEAEPRKDYLTLWR
jgi:gliding motility-associated-like protein